jgi:hypothetical protein
LAETRRSPYGIRQSHPGSHRTGAQRSVIAPREFPNASLGQTYYSNRISSDAEFDTSYAYGYLNQRPIHFVGALVARGKQCRSALISGWNTTP